MMLQLVLAELRAAIRAEEWFSRCSAGLNRRAARDQQQHSSLLQLQLPVQEASFWRKSGQTFEWIYV